MNCQVRVAESHSWVSPARIPGPQPKSTAWFRTGSNAIALPARGIGCGPMSGVRLSQNDAPPAAGWRTEPS